MRRLIAVGTTAVALTLPQQAETHRLPHKPFAKMSAEQEVCWLKRQVHHARSAVGFWERRRSPHFSSALRARDLRFHRVSLRIATKSLTALERALILNLPPIPAILRVFGLYGSQAVSVADCETGGTFSVHAKNGQYLGLFQMGDWERHTYGHGSTPLAQAQAAYRYFVASGRDWSPWACKP